MVRDLWQSQKERVYTAQNQGQHTQAGNRNVQGIYGRAEEGQGQEAQVHRDSDCQDAEKRGPGSQRLQGSVFLPG